MVIVRRHGDRLEWIGSTALEWLAYGLATFLVLFPKGGFKAGPIPLTWGYGLLGIALILGLPFCLYRATATIRRGTLAVILCLLPIQLCHIYSVVVYGVDSFGFALSDVVAFFVLPFVFLAAFSQFLPNLRLERLVRVVGWMVFLAAAYGIFLFAWRMATGKYIEIPYLTVNVDDLGTLDSKFNGRGDGLFKLISTYNNGNQYGVATLILLPLLDAFDNSRFRKLLVRVALFLTLSRTVWIGLVINEALDILRFLWRDIASSRALAIRFESLLRVSRLALVSVLVLGMTLIFSGVSFLFDSSLGGRTATFDLVQHPEFLPTAPLGAFYEIIYLSAVLLFGWSGLIAIVVLFFSPLALAASFSELRRTRIQTAALQGLVLYIALAGMDGALNYIPTMAFYWFLWMLFLYGGDNHSASIGERETSMTEIGSSRARQHLMTTPTRQPVRS
jgi:hypothetical protein